LAEIIACYFCLQNSDETLAESVKEFYEKNLKFIEANKSLKDLLELFIDKEVEPCVIKEEHFNSLIIFNSNEPLF
jgi:F0F1-type ATP synthase gamma subunit